ncbi:hypothetical protein MHH52_20125 [Paenibacillus sp. FSL K6-0276]|uniref:hypothetical protein n=1 Tax=Paenibacillus sp. FSL K6-0276 TaxID=2921450 RepID=UPI0030EBE8E4
MTTLKKERIPELQLVRALCIIAVITVHATSYATIQMTGSRRSSPPFQTLLPSR